MKVKIISQYHPAAALHQPRLWAVMLSDWEHLPQEVPNDYILVDESKAYPQYVAMDTENDRSGTLGEWSLAYRNGAGTLCVERYEGRKLGKVIDVDVIFHNAKWDIRVLKRNGMKPPERVQDTMIAAYCLGLGRQAPKDMGKEKSGSDMVGGLGLKYLARRHLGMRMLTWHDVYNKPELVPEYNDADSIATYLLWEQWKDKLPEHYWTIDMPLLPVLMAMEDRGILIEQGFLHRFEAHLDKELESIELPINPSSPQQIQSYVYGTLGVEPWKFTDTGAPSTDADVLEVINDPVIQDILKHRELSKEKSTYIDNYVQGSRADNRIHTEFKQTSTSTGRLSSAKPNLQNVPDPKKGSDMRKLFIAPPGMQLVRMDWKLVEFGMLAVLAQDDRLINAFLNGDIHQETADALGVERGVGKHINFLMQNGGSAWGMSREYGIPIQLAKEYISKYFQRFPAIKRFHEEVVGKANETKRVVGPFGRSRRLDALFAPDWRVRQEGEREAKTMPMQNGAAEVVKLAMIDLHYNYKAPMLIMVHDELLFEVDAKDALEYAHWLKSYVPTITPVKGIEFPVTVGIGQNWLEAGLEENEV